MQPLGERVLDEIEADKGLRKRLAGLLMMEPDVRLALINAVLTDVAKKEDIRELRSEISQFRGELNQLRSEINQLRAEVSSNFRWTVGTILWGATVIPIPLRLIGII